jgi:hypothetical protein
MNDQCENPTSRRSELFKKIDALDSASYTVAQGTAPGTAASMSVGNYKQALESWLAERRLNENPKADVRETDRRLNVWEPARHTLTQAEQRVLAAWLAATPGSAGLSGPTATATKTSRNYGADTVASGRLSLTISRTS